jgi:hypothetical protein
MDKTGIKNDTKKYWHSNIVAYAELFLSEEDIYYAR